MLDLIRQTFPRTYQIAIHKKALWSTGIFFSLYLSINRRSSNKIVHRLIVRARGRCRCHHHLMGQSRPGRGAQRDATLDAPTTLIIPNDYSHLQRIGR